MFSERFGFKVKNIFQKDDMDEKLRVDIWNTIQKYFLDRVSYETVYSSDPFSGERLYACNNYNYIIELYENFFILPINDLGDRQLYSIKQSIAKYYNSLDWFRVYDLIEFINNFFENDDDATKDYFTEEINTKLERNNSAYRLIEENLCPITNDEEIQSIEESLNTKYNVVNAHINKAIQLFSDKNAADYENTIKESITAVETLCSIIVGNKATLGEALKLLESKKVSIHPALKSSFNSLYGYTSDGNGIRHAGDLGGKNSTFAEAKFMLVSCSAFINYLIENFENINK